MATVTAQTTLGIEHCCVCGIAFAMPEDIQRRRRNDHKDFFCPVGHRQHYLGKSEEERLRALVTHERDMRRSLREQRDHLERSNSAYRGHLTRLRRRIAHGVCPCCNRTFKQLSRHMERQHPDYVDKHGCHDAEEKPES